MSLGVGETAWRCLVQEHIHAQTASSSIQAAYHTRLEEAYGICKETTTGFQEEIFSATHFMAASGKRGTGGAA